MIADLPHVDAAHARELFTDLGKYCMGPSAGKRRPPQDDNKFSEIAVLRELKSKTPPCLGKKRGDKGGAPRFQLLIASSCLCFT